MKTVCYTLLLILVLTSSVSAQKPELLIGSDEWLPYTGPVENHGYMLEVAETVFARRGIQTTYKPAPWVRVLAAVRNGHMMAAAGMVKEEAPDFILPEEPLGTYNSSFFVLANDSWTYTGVESLHGKSLGVIKDYLYEDNLDRYIQENIDNPARIAMLQGDDPLRSNIRKLLTGRIDVLVESSTVFYYKVKLMGLRASDFREIPLNKQPRWLYIGFSPAHEKSREYAKILSEGVRALRQTGELTRILNKYGVTDWKPHE